MPNSNSFAYAITERAPFVVVTFKGEIIREASSALDQCHYELMNRSRAFCVLDFHDVMSVDYHSVRPLVQLQAMLRDRGAVRVCGLNADVRTFLTDKIAIRTDEVTEDLK